MSKWIVHTESADYRDVWAYSASEAMRKVWNRTLGRCGSIWSAERA